MHVCMHLCMDACMHACIYWSIDLSSNYFVLYQFILSYLSYLSYLIYLIHHVCVIYFIYLFYLICINDFIDLIDLINLSILSILSILSVFSIVDRHAISKSLANSLIRSGVYQWLHQGSWHALGSSSFPHGFDPTRDRVRHGTTPFRADWNFTLDPTSKM